MQQISDGQLLDFMRGALHFDNRSGSVLVRRLDDSTLASYPRLSGTAACAPGVRLCLQTDSDFIALRFRPHPNPHAYEQRPPICSLTSNNEHLGSKVVADGKSVTFSLKGESGSQYSIWLPTSPGLGLVAIGVAEGARVIPAQSSQSRWAFYGSSITHGTGMPPALIWPSLLARYCNYEPYNFGFDGNALLEIEVAEDILKSRPHRVTLEMGINCFLTGQFREENIIPAMEKFLKVFARKETRYPIDVLTPFRAPRYEASTINGVTLNYYRSAIETAARSIDLPNVNIVDGITLLTPKEEILPDGLHPSISGHQMIARNYPIMTQSDPF